MGEVIRPTFITRLDVPVERILAAAQEANLKSVFVCGYTEDGEEYIVSSHADGGEVCWLMERAKRKMHQWADEASNG